MLDFKSGILWPPLYTVKWTREHFPIMFFTARRHSDRSAVGLTGSYETLQIDQAEVRTKCANSILVRIVINIITRKRQGRPARPCQEWTRPIVDKQQATRDETVWTGAKAHRSAMAEPRLLDHDSVDYPRASTS